MSLTLRITSQHTFLADADTLRSLGTGGSLTIGRAPGNDWVLPDPELVISGRHCTVHEEQGRYVLTDTSTNGVYLRGQRVGRGNSQALQAGDEIGIGEYRIAVELAAGAGTPPAAGADIFGLATPVPAPSHDAVFGPAAGAGHDPFGLGADSGDPFGLAAPAPAAGGFGPGAPAADPFDVIGAGAAPATADPFGLAGGPAEFAAPAPASHLDPADAGSDPFGLLAPAPTTGTPVPDHVPSEQQAFVPPAPISGDDWDALFAAPAPTPKPAPPAGVDAPLAGLAAADVTPAAAEARKPAAAPLAPPAPKPAPAPAPLPGAAPANPAAASALIDALLAGAGLEHLLIPEDRQAELMHALGDSYRRMVQGLMSVLRARSHMKGEFRMQQTSIRPIENNPLKFAPNVEETMTLLLTTRSSSYLSPERAISEAFEDLQAHQLAMMAGMQAALGHLFRRFDPATLEARFGSGGLLPGSRKARCWEQFTALYQDIAREAEDDFQELFGREFVRAYEEQIARLRTR